MGRKDLSDVRRSEIMDAFYRCLVKNGLEGCTIINIAREADMTPSLITHYFDSKEEMATELTMWMLDLIETELTSELTAIEDPRERLGKLISIIFSDELLNIDFERACVAMAYRATRNEVEREALNSLNERFRKLLKDTLVQAAAPGAVTPKEAERVSAVIWAVNDGITQQWVLDPERVRPGMALDVVRTLLEHVLAEGLEGGRRKTSQAR